MNAALKALVAGATASLLLTQPADACTLTGPVGVGPIPWPGAGEQPTWPGAGEQPAQPRAATTTRSFVGVVTAYCSAGIMADGSQTHVGAAAAERDVPMHSRIWVAGVGNLVVEDRGQAGLFAVDVFMPSCHAAIIFGRTRRLIQILES